MCVHSNQSHIINFSRFIRTFSRAYPQSPHMSRRSFNAHTAHTFNVLYDLAHILVYLYTKWNAKIWTAYICRILKDIDFRVCVCNIFCANLFLHTRGEC